MYLCMIFLSVVSVVYSSAFESIDVNQDHMIDRSEFDTYVTHLVDANLASGASVTTSFDWTFGLGSVGASGTAANTLPDTSDPNFVSATINGLAIILVTELGDKTFFIAAILAMSNGRLVVYSGAMLALGLMHVLSCVMGIALPSILPRKYTHFASALLFLYFGIQLLKDAYEMSGEGPSEELQEVEEELIAKKEDTLNDDDKADEVEAGMKIAGSPKGNNLNSNDSMRVFMQSFSLTFLAEWGDRSQIATIGLAASKNVWGIILGGLIGHAFCTGLAVVGGRMLAAKISAKTVSYVGGGLFLVFGLHALLFQS
jgi:Ca2+/H+ antiporter, TMEM165/GDT1 family